MKKEKRGKSSILTKDECFKKICDLEIALSDLTESELDDIYYAVFENKPYHLTKHAYVKSLNKYRLDNIMC